MKIMSTAELLNERLQKYLEAEQRILQSQEYRIGDRQLKRAELAKVREAIKELTAEVEVAQQGGSGSIRRVVF